MLVIIPDPKRRQRLHVASRKCLVDSCLAETQCAQCHQGGALPIL